MSSACTDSSPEETPPSPAPAAAQGAAPPPSGAAASERPLAAALEARLAEFRATAPPERAAIYEEGVEAVGNDAAMDSALRARTMAPDFTLPDATGRPVSLATLREKGPVVLVWYRGGWCPYCNLQLRAYQEMLPDFAEAGATLVAISPELPDRSLTTAEKNELAFPVLSDAGNAVARRYGLAYRLPDAVIDQFRGRLDLPAINGDESWELPLAVVYVVDTDGAIAWASVDHDYRRRAEPADVLAAVEALGAP